VAEAPTKAKASEVVGYVLSQFHEARERRAMEARAEEAKWAATANDSEVSPGIRAEAQRTLEALQRRRAEGHEEAAR
jgi:hypothetical protein